ncbi:uncharacterized protein J3R85_011192 [Psidium guajava]|nr:uncharacterized protein J3R85_011192 [Psidium guajava]
MIFLNFWFWNLPMKLARSPTTCLIFSALSRLSKNTLETETFFLEHYHKQP